MRAPRFSLALSLVFIAASACGRVAVPSTTLLAAAAEGNVVLHNGVNDLALLGDATPGQIFVTWRGNYNGHGFSVATFAVRNPSDRDDASTWQVLPFFGGPHDGDAGREVFRTSEGADCILGDVRVVRHVGRPVDVIIASRELGASFADPAPVRFDYYRVVRNTDRVAGWPPTYLQFDHAVQAKTSYCDVNAAFDRELHLGVDGLGRAEGGR